MRDMDLQILEELDNILPEPETTDDSETTDD